MTGEGRGARVAGRLGRPGVVVLVSCLGVAAALGTQADPQAERVVDRTIYTSASWLVLAGLAVVGLAMVGGDRSDPASRLRLVAPAVGLVFAAQLAGTGVWAAKHWEPFYGMRAGIGVPLMLLRGLAVLLVASGVAAGVACVWQLV